MNVLLPDVDGTGRRMALALLLALGLHAALLFGVPASWRSFHFPAPRRFDVVLPPPVERPGIPEPAVALGPAKPEVAPGVPAAVTGPEPAIPPPEPGSAAPSVSPPPVATPTPPAAPEPAPPARPEAVVVARPVRSAPPRPAVATRLAPKPPTITQSAAPPKPVKPPQVATVEPLAQPAATPREKIPPPVKPVPPVTLKAAPQPAPSASRPGRPERAGGAAVTRPAGRVDSTALLGQIAGLEADAERKASAGVRSRRVTLTDTRSPAGFYAADWARKVTRVGEMNFPDAARRLNQSAGPLLEVAIRADGSLQEVRVMHSSGNAELDRAARRIVELAAPYPPFPAELRQQVDLLKIESPWRFDPGGRIQAR
jgi:protein TonB